VGSRGCSCSGRHLNAVDDRGDLIVHQCCLFPGTVPESMTQACTNMMTQTQACTNMMRTSPHTHAQTMLAQTQLAALLGAPAEEQGPSSNSVVPFPGGNSITPAILRTAQVCVFRALCSRDAHMCCYASLEMAELEGPIPFVPHCQNVPLSSPSPFSAPSL
jgi:hypothetical protein